jgi:hypothetical protein
MARRNVPTTASNASTAPTPQDPENESPAEPVGYASGDALSAFPTVFPPGQLFVGVSESDGAGIGFDGGPEKGGHGGWARGDVREWTSSDAVPLAIRDPQDGLIVRGYVEPVEEVERRDGRLVCVTSTKYFGEYARRGKRGEWVPAEPTAKALVRARKGAEPLTQAFLTPAGQAAAKRSQQLATAGIGI